MCPFSIHLLLDVGCICVLVVVSSAIINVGVQASLQQVNFFLSIYVPSSGIAGLYGGSGISLLRNLHVVFCSGYANLHL